MSLPPEKHAYSSPEQAARIYLLPNLFTAGNMLCGFLAIKNCIEARFTDLAASARADHDLWAVWFILGACLCDLFDGRVARATRRESLFGAEFDSIADTVSFGVAPALMACFLIINPDGSVDAVPPQAARPRPTRTSSWRPGCSPSSTCSASASG